MSMTHARKTSLRTMVQLLPALLAAAPALAQQPYPAPELGSLPSKAPAMQFTPLAEQAAQGRISEPASAAAAATGAEEAPAPTPRSERPARRRTRDAIGIEHAIFDRRPVSVVLRVDRERLVHLPFAAMLDLPPTLDGVLEVQIIEDTLYLTAREPIARSRVLAHALDGTGVVALDLSATAHGDPKPELEVQYPGDASPQDGAAQVDEEAGLERPDMVVLTRYAAQQLYSPRRLLKPLPGVRQTAVERTPVTLYRDSSVVTAALGAWTSGELFVTAVRFSNAGSVPLELDMERLRGRWLAATPQHWRLLPKGSEADTTVVYLVSEQPFDTIREE